MTTGYVERALLKISNGSPKQIFNILVEIRTKVIKTTTGVKQLIQHGFVHKLLYLLSDDVREKQLPQTTDIVLSLLGNLCMEENARKDVLKCGGIPVLADIFCTLESASVQNRSCRALANAAMLAVNAEAIHKTDTLDRVVELLQLSPSKESKLIFCRTIRLLGKMPRHQDKVVSNDAVRCVAKLLSDEDKEVSSAALRMVFEVSTPGCSSGFASQVVSAGGIAVLLSWVTDEDSTCAHQSFTTLMRLVEHSHVRAELGNAGGITQFIDYFEGLGDFDKSKRFSILNVLCLCCKDVVNRVKIRENNILPKFLDCLKNEDYKRLHDRVISALQCFLYDESSLEFLLQNGMVPLLLTHLQRVAEFTSTVIKLDEETAELDITASSDSGQTELDRTSSELDNTMSSECVKAVSDKENQTQPFEINTQESEPEMMDVQKELVTKDQKYTHDVADNRETICDQTEDESSTSSNCRHSTKDDDNVDSEATSDRKYHYSIDSPTYQVSSKWNMDSYSRGVKCKQSFTQDTTSPPYHSPLSTISYYSPSLSPGDYSPCHSPASPVMSKVNEDPHYGLVCSIPFSYGSPEKQRSPCDVSGLSPNRAGHELMQDSGGQAFYMIYSDEEDSQEASPNVIFTDKNKTTDFRTETNCDESSMQSIENNDVINNMSCECSVIEHHSKIHAGSARNADVVSLTSTVDGDTVEKKRHSDPGKETSKKLKDDIMDEESEDQMKNLVDPENHGKGTVPKGEDTKRFSKKNKIPPTSMESPEKQHVFKKPRLTERKAPTATEDHILIILSFVSQMPDPSKYLVSREVLCCLLDYIGCVQNGETRAARVLCRIARNPNCFERLIQLDLPWMVYDKLLSWEKNDKCWSKILKERHSGLDRKHHRSWSLSVCSDDSSLFEDDDLLQDFLTDVVGSKSSEIATKREGSTNQDKMDVSNDASDMDGDIIPLSSRAGITVLRDLCRMADSPFGRGVVLHVLSKRKNSQMHILVSLLHILWTRGMWKYYLFQNGLWQTFMDVLTSGPEHNYYHAILEAFCFLGKIINFEIKSKDNSEDLFVSSVGELDDTQEQECSHGAKSQSHDVNFCVDGSKHPIPASKAILAQASPLFEAMLLGQYSESTQKTIVLKDTSCYAVQFIIHFLHGCDLRCDIINSVLTCNTNPKAWRNCLDVLSLGNRYLITDLEPFLKSVLTSRFLGPMEANNTYSFAKLHGYEVLATDCVKMVLVGGNCVSDRMKGFQLFLNGSNSEMFLSHLEQLFKSNIH